MNARELIDLADRWLRDRFGYQPATTRDRLREELIREVLRPVLAAAQREAWLAGYDANPWNDSAAERDAALTAFLHRCAQPEHTKDEQPGHPSTPDAKGTDRCS